MRFEILKAVSVKNTVLQYDTAQCREEAATFYS